MPSNMRSSSSRNLASSPNSSRALRNQLHPQLSQDSTESQREQFIAMQVLQAVLFTARIFFLSYEIVYTVIHKSVIYERVGYILGGSPLESESLYTACLFLIALFLISQIIITFVYNYIIVHENLNGIIAMGVFLVMVLVYYVFTFGRFPMSKLESICVCIASAFEIFGLFYLYILMKHKKAYRYVQQFEKRFSVVGPGGLSGGLDTSNGNGANRQLPHQRRIDAKGIGSPTPPAITISYTGNEENKQTEEDDAPESELTISQQDEDQDRASEQEHENSPAENESQTFTHHQRHHRNKHSSNMKQSRKNISDNESESSVSVPEQHSQHPHHHHHHPRPTKHRSKDLLTVPGQFSDLDEQEEEEKEEMEEESERPHQRPNSRAPSSSPVHGEEHRHQSSSRSRPLSSVPHQESSYQSAHQVMHRPVELYKHTSLESSSSYPSGHNGHHHQQQHHQQHYPLPQGEYYQQPVYDYTEEYVVSRSPANYHR